MHPEKKTAEREKRENR